MELRVGVKAILENSEGKILLLKRSPEKYPQVKTLWDIPGGRIDPGSTLFDNLKREIEEETGFTIVDEPRLIAAQDIIYEGKHVVRLTYYTKTEGVIPKLSDEHSEYRWLSKAELKSFDGIDPYLAEVCASWL